MEEQNRYTGNIKSSIRKDGGARGSGNGTKKENLYRDRTSGGNPAGIVLSYFCEWIAVFSTGEGKSQQPVGDFYISCGSGLRSIVFYDLRRVAVTKNGEYRNNPSEKIFQIPFGDIGGCAGILSVGWRESVGKGIF